MGGGAEGLDVAGRGKCWKSEVVNGFVSDDCDGRLSSREGLHTYKRRKRTGSSSERKDLGSGSGEAAQEETMKKPPDHPAGGSSGSNNGSQGQWRNYILEQMYRSLSDDKGGIKDVLGTSLKVSDACDKAECKSAKKMRPCGASDGPNHRTVTDTCRLVIHGMISSEFFTSLCRLLYENFDESRTDNLFSLSDINRRMVDGDYEHQPSFFSRDIQQFWKKFEGIGTELIFLARSLSDESTKSFEKQLATEDQTEADLCKCRHCGKKADDKDYLVCDSCEEMYHISCIDPPVEEIPPKTWYCSGCLADGTCTHENCVVCERLDNQAHSAVYQSSEETLSDIRESPCQMSEDTDETGSALCKPCGSEIETGGKVKICEHSECPNKYYHMRCLTTKQLISHGPHWYCPSCLCQSCLADKDDHDVVLCDGCDNGYHIYCMEPPRSCVPTGKWFCRHCVLRLGKVRRAREAYEKRVNDGREGITLLLNASLMEDKFAGIGKQKQGS
ncbi:PHD finger protein EHD3 [Linum grandiflorum]